MAPSTVVAATVALTLSTAIGLTLLKSHAAGTPPSRMQQVIVAASKDIPS